MIDPKIKELLGYDRNEPDDEVLKKWKERAFRVCKPCWEIKYCPYGPWVEESPLLPSIRSEEVEHNEYLKECLETGFMRGGEPLDRGRREIFKKRIAEFNPEDYPEVIPEEIASMQCTVFGHICPVAFTAEAYTETTESRREGRSISFPTRSRIVRRDNFTCQICGKHLKDDEVEFDHIIPLSKGGSSEESNIQLTCFKCNRGKSDKIEL